MENLKKKEKIKEKYNSTSFFYDKRYKQIQYEKYQQIIKINLTNKSLLDAGCGTGLLYQYFNKVNESQKKKNFQYVGVDISYNMLERFKLKMETKKVENIRFLHLILGDLENLPFRPDSFNVLFSITSYQNLPKMERGIIESLRTLKENALIFISILKKKLDKDDIINFLKNIMDITKIHDNEEIEDIMIKGRNITPKS